ncbi:PREDICTED: interferon regulatory factor 2-like [Branchiostoma belcheri]|uniref:Interferon regulatory factor 2-like n=1 Tax=Branchiostoma belcheri TaxID=7741 RepID=A0A6P4ZPQ0_BRABE|nr:PREDICTED: interferon regulatory factor 2-like [Branchiostoma belcheri]XP_019635994.1 PREDICTED: interferon regulatory factor 2-like [Branchiostoma belcheri]
MTVFEDTVPSPAYAGDMSAQGEDPGQKLRMRPWLEQQLDTEKYHGFCWLDKKERKFKVPWIHASSQHFNHMKHSAVFKAWAVHTGRFDPEKSEVPYEKVSLWKTWKANFRCALNSLPDVVELRAENCKAKGEAAYKVYRIVDRKPKRRKSRGSQSHTSPPPVSHKTGRVVKKRSAPIKSNCRHHRGKQLAALVRQTREEAPPFGNIDQNTSEKLPPDHAYYTKSGAPSDTADSLLTFPPSVPEASHGSPAQPTDPGSTVFPLSFVKTESSSDDGSDSDNNSDISDNVPTDEEVVEDVLGLEETHSNRGNSPARDANDLEETVFPNSESFPTAFMQSPGQWPSSGTIPNCSTPGWLASNFQNTAASCASSSASGTPSPAVVVQPARSLDPLTNTDSLLPTLGIDESTMKEIMSILLKAKTTPPGQTAYSTTLTTTARMTWQSPQHAGNYGGLTNMDQGNNAPAQTELMQTSTASPIPVPRTNYLYTTGGSNPMDHFNGAVPVTSAPAQPQSLLHSLVQGSPKLITTTTVSG